MLRRRVLLSAAVVGAAALAVVLLLADDDKSTTPAGDEAATPRPPPRLVRTGSEPAPDLGGDLVLGPARSTSRVVYEVRSPGSAPISEQIWVRRPFESRLESYAGPRPGPATTETESGFRHRANRSAGGGDAVVLTRPPGLGVYDLRVDYAVDDAVDAGLLDRREWRRVLDRPCQVFRAGATVADGRLRPASDGGEYADVCIDAGGHILEEWWVGDDDRPIRQRLAVDIEDALVLPDGFFRLPTRPSVAVDQGAGAVTAVTPDSRPPDADFFALDTPPSGFAHQGRYTVIPPQAGLIDPAQRSSVVASMADVWVRGVDYLVVDQGGALNSRPTFTFEPFTRKVDLGALGQGEELPGFAGSEVRVSLPTGRYVRVHGTLPMRDLVAVARALHPIPGGTLTLIEPVTIP